MSYSRSRSRTVFSSSWSRVRQAIEDDEWQYWAPESTLLGFIREIAAN